MHGDIGQEYVHGRVKVRDNFERCPHYACGQKVGWGGAILAARLHHADVEVIHPEAVAVVYEEGVGIGQEEALEGLQRNGVSRELHVQPLQVCSCVGPGRAVALQTAATLKNTCTVNCRVVDLC